MAFNYKTELQRYRKYYQSLEPLVSRPSSHAYTTVVFSFLAVSLFGWYAIRPTLQTILYLKREITDDTVTNKQMEDKITALIGAQAYYQQVEPLLPAVDEALPPTSDAIPAAIQFRNLASASGVLLTSLQIPGVPLSSPNANQTTTTSVTPVKEAPISISVTVKGDYQSIRSFLNGIISLRRIAAIDSISLGPAPGESTSSQSAILSSRLLLLSVHLKIFYIGT